MVWLSLGFTLDLAREVAPAVWTVVGLGLCDGDGRDGGRKDGSGDDGGELHDGRNLIRWTLLRRRRSSVICKPYVQKSDCG